MLSVSNALSLVLGEAPPMQTVQIPLNLSLGRVLAEELSADRDLPPFDRVTMDGFAVRSKDFAEIVPTLTIIGIIGAGEDSNLTLEAGQAIQIMTGAPLPNGADAVIQVEHCKINRGQVSFLKEQIPAGSIQAGKNFAPKGEDAKKGDAFFQAGENINTALIAFLASIGKAEVLVYQQPSLAILSTGTEIISTEETPKPYQIRDCNSPSSVSLAQSIGINPLILGIAPDEEENLQAKIQEGLQSDILVLSGGVSMGEFDLVPKILEQAGVVEIFHKVHLKPGKPLWFGKHKNGVVFGLPGNPVSVQVCFKIFVEPFILKRMGSKSSGWDSFFLPLAKASKKRTDREQFTSAAILNEGGSSTIEEVKTHGSGDFTNLVRSEGLFRFPPNQFELDEATLVEFIPWKRRR